MDELHSFFKTVALAYICHYGAWRMEMGLPCPNFTTSPTVAPNYRSLLRKPIFGPAGNGQNVGFG